MLQSDVLTDLKNKIDESIERVKGIEFFQTKTTSSETLKNEIIPILEGLKNRIQNIYDIMQKLDGVRHEIISPVVKIIADSNEESRQFDIYSRRFNKLSLLMAIVGIVLTVFSFALTVFSPNSGQNNNNNIKEVKIPSQKIIEQNPYLADLESLDSVSTVSQHLDSCSSKFIYQIDSLLKPIYLNKFKRDSVFIYTNAVDKILHDMKSVNCINELTYNKYYQTMVSLNFLSDNIPKMTNLINRYKTTIAQKTINISPLLDIYEIEAGYIKSNNPEITLKKYDNLPLNAVANEIIMQPYDHSAITCGNYVKTRMVELKNIREREAFRILVINSKNSNKHIRICTALKKNGFSKAFIQDGRWPINFLNPYLYYRQVNFEKSFTKDVIQNLPEIQNLKFQYYLESSGDGIKNIFKKDESLDLLLILD